MWGQQQRHHHRQGHDDRSHRRNAPLQHGRSVAQSPNAAHHGSRPHEQASTQRQWHWRGLSLITDTLQPHGKSCIVSLCGELPSHVSVQDVVAAVRCERGVEKRFAPSPVGSASLPLSACLTLDGCGSYRWTCTLWSGRESPACGTWMRKSLSLALPGSCCPESWSARATAHCSPCSRHFPMDAAR